MVLIDKTRRLSEFVEVERDDIVGQVERRARKFQGWRGKINATAATESAEIQRRRLLGLSLRLGSASRRWQPRNDLHDLSI